ncbi:MAG: hypothetical protein ABEI11_00290 [Haloarculaceae archaeon]
MTDEPGDDEQGADAHDTDGAGGADGPRTLTIEHDLPGDLRDALADDTASLAGLYNDLQGLSEEAFADRFGRALSTLREVAAGRPVICVVGFELAAGDDPVRGGEVVSIHAPDGGGGVGDAVYVADAAPTDEFVMLPIRPDDCPPGSGEPVEALGVGAFREIVCAMTYKRFDLLQNDLATYRASYLRPLVAGLELYADRRASGSGSGSGSGSRSGSDAGS